MKVQRIARNKPAIAPQIIDERQPNIPPPPQIDPAIANLPLRTVLMVEVADMDSTHVQLLVQEINKVYEGARGGIHYVIPIRHGCIGSDILFESEFLNVVRNMCEVKDGEIVLKDGATDCHIIRQTI